MKILILMILNPCQKFNLWKIKVCGLLKEELKEKYIYDVKRDLTVLNEIKVIGSLLKKKF